MNHVRRVGGAPTLAIFICFGMIRAEILSCDGGGVEGSGSWVQDLGLGALTSRDFV